MKTKLFLFLFAVLLLYSIIMTFLYVRSGSQKQIWTSRLQEWQQAVTERDAQIASLQQELQEGQARPSDEDLQQQLIECKQEYEQLREKIASPFPAAQPTPTPAPKPVQPAPTPTPKIQETVFDWIQLRKEIRNNKTTMTEIQYNSWWKKKRQRLQGKQIVSQGFVEDVEEDSGELTIQIDIDPPSDTFSVYDIILEMNPQKDKALATQLRRDSHITFTGRISEIDYILGSLKVHFENVKILDR